MHQSLPGYGDDYYHDINIQYSIFTVVERYLKVSIFPYTAVPLSPVDSCKVGSVSGLILYSQCVWIWWLWSLYS